MVTYPYFFVTTNPSRDWSFRHELIGTPYLYKYEENRYVVLVKEDEVSAAGEFLTKQKESGNIESFELVPDAQSLQ